MDTTDLYISVVDSPIGPLEITGSERGIRAIAFDATLPPDPPTVPGALQPAVQQLGEFFRGERHTFSLALDAEGTAFQRSVWDALMHVPFGQTASYLDLALALGDRNSTRAVGAANGRNPIPIIVPCHRVIGSNGSLTGYAGGLERKKWLLEFERSFREPTLF